MQAAQGGQLQWAAPYLQVMSVDPPQQRWSSHACALSDNEGFSRLHCAVLYQGVGEVKRLLQSNHGKVTHYYINCIHDIQSM